MNKKELLATVIRGNAPSFEMGCEASQVFTAWGGKFVKIGATGYADLADDGDTELVGWMDAPAKTTSATANAEKFPVYSDLSSIFQIPLRYDAATYSVNYADTLIGKTCDLIVVAGVQYANLTTSTEDVIVVVGGLAASSSSANDGYILCKLNPAKMGATGVA